MKRFLAFLLIVLLAFPAVGSAASQSLIKYGDKGDPVTVLQAVLAQNGFTQQRYITGYFGSITRAALKAYQKAEGLKADGVAGPQTLERLLGAEYKSVLSDLTVKNAAASPKTDPQAQALPPAEVKPPVTQIYSNIVYGQTSELVKYVQNRLLQLGYLNISETTDYFGDATLDAVLSFQQLYGMTPTGMVDPMMYAVMISSDAKAYSDLYRPVTLPQPPAQTAVSGTSNPNVYGVLSAALAQLGKGYKYAAKGPDYYDCSGLVYYSYFLYGVKLPASSEKQALYDKGIVIAQTSMLLPGDIVFFNTGNKSQVINHCGIYLGEGQFIHASSGAGKVQINVLSEGYYADAFRWGVRVFW